MQGSVVGGSGGSAEAPSSGFTSMDVTEGSPIVDVLISPTFSSQELSILLDVSLSPLPMLTLHAAFLTAQGELCFPQQPAHHSLTPTRSVDQCLRKHNIDPVAAQMLAISVNLAV